VDQIRSGGATAARSRYDLLPHACRPKRYNMTRIPTRTTVVVEIAKNLLGPDGSRSTCSGANSRRIERGWCKAHPRPPLATTRADSVAGTAGASMSRQLSCSSFEFDRICVDHVLLSP